LGRFAKFFLGLVFIAAAVAVMAVRWFIHEINAPGPLAAEKLVYISPGTPVRSIAPLLLDAGVIGNEKVFLIDARWRNQQVELKAGEYQFLPGMNIGEVIALLQSGKTYQHKITIPEGLMATEIVALLQNEPVLTGGIVALPPEGSLQPETYKFSYGDTREKIINRMEKAMQQTLGALWEKRAADLPFKTPAEAVVLASIVEKETALPNERPRVAGVFINRLNKNIPLQSDPTVIYAVTQGKQKLPRPLTLQDLKMASAYNTYVVAGLPPAPIANPGKASLAAVLNPEKNDFIYFVADGTGGHVFAKTLEEHNNNVARWRALQKQSR
jgi:UPF0755 protein